MLFSLHALPLMSHKPRKLIFSVPAQVKHWNIILQHQMWVIRQMCSSSINPELTLECDHHLLVIIILSTTTITYSRGQPKSTNLVIVIWGPCTTLNSTFYCRNVKIRTQCFNFHEPIFQNWWNEKFYLKNIGRPWNVPLNSWKIAQSTPFSILHLILEFGTNLMSCSCRKKWFYTT